MELAPATIPTNPTVHRADHRVFCPPVVHQPLPAPITTPSRRLQAIQSLLGDGTVATPRTPMIAPNPLQPASAHRHRRHPTPRPVSEARKCSLPSDLSHSSRAPRTVQQHLMCLRLIPGRYVRLVGRRCKVLLSVLLDPYITSIASSAW